MQFAPFLGVQITGRSLKEDSPIYFQRTGEEFGIYFEAVSVHAKGPRARNPIYFHPYFHTGSTLGFLIHGFWAQRKSTICGVWAAPAARKSLPKGRALLASLFGSVFPGCEGRPDLQKPTISGRPKTMY